MPLSKWESCEQYQRLLLDTPLSSNCTQIVPRRMHGMGKGALPLPRAFRENAAANPSFTAHYLGDDEARDYVLAHCGAAAAAAYDCLLAPAFRADLARYCFLWTEGGVYTDGDISLLRPLEQVVSMCADATIGYDIPQSALMPKKKALKLDALRNASWEEESSDLDRSLRPGMQMKLLAGTPGHPLFRCMLESIVKHVRVRFVSRWPLAITGPHLLHWCYEQVGGNTSGVHITYRDSRGARWPYSGMMGNTGLLAFERPTLADYDSSRRTALSELHYTELLEAGRLYRNECSLHR